MSLMVDDVGGIGGCRCDDQNRNKEIERVAKLGRGQMEVPRSLCQLYV